MMFALIAFVFLFSVTLLVRADNTFLFPPSSGVNVTAGSNVNLRWTTNWGPVPISLSAFQYDLGYQPDNNWRWLTLLGRWDLKGCCELS